jgi:Putative Flp pilus-assembly TadE/G-like
VLIKPQDEKGQTLLIVVICMAVLIGMAALAIDIATLYTAHNETRRAAEAAALAGAHAIATSGVTSGWLTQGQACSGSVGSPGLAEQRALAMVAQDTVAGGTATLQATSCNFGVATNPRFTVTVQRTGLPTFFGRIFGSVVGTATASATAEAYNPSGGSGPPLQVGSVKPWAIPNCDPTPANTSPANPSCGTGPGGTPIGYFIDTSGAIAHAGSIVNTVFDLTEVADGPVTGGSWAVPPVPPTPPASNPANIKFLAVDVPITAASASCPAPGTLSCADGSLQAAAPGFGESIACANSTALSSTLLASPPPFNVLNVHPGTGASSPHITDEPAALCLIHASVAGRGHGQDEFCNNAPIPNCTVGSPISITGGDSNPDPLLRGQNNISRSDSVITVPVFNPCGVSCTNSSVTIVGFLQLGIVEVTSGAGGSPAGPLRVMVMNVIGRGASSATPVSGGDVSPIPVRLVQ